MRIGVAKEIKPDEYRIALTPAGALELINHGHEVAIEQGAGLGSSFPDEAFTRVGAEIVSVDDVWQRSDLVLKVKEPIEVEYPRWATKNDQRRCHAAASNAFEVFSSRTSFIRLRPARRTVMARPGISSFVPDEGT